MTISGSVSVVSAGSPVAAIPASHGYLAYPDLRIIAPIPADVATRLEPIWRRSIARGGPTSIYRLRDVFVASEGLVFDMDGALIDITRTYHSDDEVGEAAIAVIEAGRARTNIRSIEKGILAKSRGATNYGHFILEMLPRAWLARQHLRLDDWPAIIHAEEPALERVARQALTSVGFPDSLVVAVGHEPTFVDELIVVHGLGVHSLYISPLAMQCLDDMTAHIAAGPPRKLYAARTPATCRDFEDEPAVAAALASADYERIVTGEMTFEAQVSAFKGASEVVGVAGAALANTLFCQPGTKVAAFMPCSASEVLFWMIAEGRRLRYREIRCPESGPLEGDLAWDRSVGLGPSAILDCLRDL